MTTVVNVRHDHYDVYIGRGGQWGNPFRIGPDGTREEVIEKHRLWIPGQPQLLRQLPMLKNKRLGCHCAPHACHGDTLAEMADANLGELWCEVSRLRDIEMAYNCLGRKSDGKETMDWLINQIRTVERPTPHVKK